MDEIDGLRRQYDRLAQFSDFRPEDRIWWIYLRGEVEKVVVAHELPELQAAYDLLKAFPENLPDEAQLWHALREAVTHVLGREGRRGR